MKAIKINQLTLSSADPKIAVSLTAADQAGLKKQLKQVQVVKPDLVEWRIDALKQFPSQEQVNETLTEIHNSIHEMPLIATFRTQNEGGSMKASEDRYFRLLRFLSSNSMVDILDVELLHDKKRVQSIVTNAHHHGVKVIMSNHDFNKVPASLVIMDRMNMMQKLNADVAKVAVMPQSKADVMRFMQTSFKANQELNIPIVTMAMGDLGKITRVCGLWSGSVISFGSMNTHVSSAPGQISVPKLRDIMTSLKGGQHD